MAEIKKLKVNNQEIYPVTHESAVYDSEGKSIEFKYLSSVSFDDGDDIVIEGALGAPFDPSYLEEDISEVNDKVTQVSSQLNTQVEELNGKIGDANDQIEEVDSKLGDLDNLQTADKNSLVGALNEVFQRGNEVKEMLVDSLIAKGLNVSTNNTFEELSSEIANINISTDTLPAFLTTVGDTWAYGEPFPEKMYSASASALDGIGYISGGYTSSKTVLQTLYSFNPSTNKWTLVATLPEELYRHAMVTVNNKLHILGGYSTKNTHYCYDPATNSWVTKTSLPAGRNAFTATVDLRDNSIYCIGGASGSTACDTNYCYDYTLNTWSEKAVLPMALYYIPSQYFDGKIYSIGGYNGSAQNPVYCYDIALNTWTTLGTTPTLLFGHFVIVEHDGIRIMGGYDSTTAYNTNYLFSPTLNTWTTQRNLPGSRRYSASFKINQNSYVVGGYSEYNQTWCYIPKPE